jgi:hypothetical protein
MATNDDSGDFAERDPVIVKILWRDRPGVICAILDQERNPLRVTLLDRNDRLISAQFKASELEHPEEDTSNWPVKHEDCL